MSATRLRLQRARHPTRRDVEADANRCATLTKTVEGQDIWVEVHGPLVAGRTRHVSKQLQRFTELGFHIAIIDSRRVTAIDAHGIALLNTFIQRHHDQGGTVQMVDPTGMLQPVTDQHTPGVDQITEQRSGTWWNPPNPGWHPADPLHAATTRPPRARPAATPATQTAP